MLSHASIVHLAISGALPNERQSAPAHGCIGAEAMTGSSLAMTLDAMMRPSASQRTCEKP